MAQSPSVDEIDARIRALESELMQFSMLSPDSPAPDAKQARELAALRREYDRRLRTLEPTIPDLEKEVLGVKAEVADLDLLIKTLTQELGALADSDEESEREHVLILKTDLSAAETQVVDVRRRLKDKSNKLSDLRRQLSENDPEANALMQKIEEHQAAAKLTAGPASNASRDEVAKNHQRIINEINLLREQKAALLAEAPDRQR